MESNHYRKFAKEVVVISIMNLVVALSALLMVPLLTKTMGAQGYGAWSQVWAILGLAIPLASLGLPFTMVRFLAAQTDKREIQDGFYSVAVIVFLNNLIISSFLILFSDVVAGLFFEGAAQMVRLTGLINLPIALNGAYLAFFRTFRRMKTYAIIEVTRTCAEFGLIAYLVLSRRGIMDILWSIFTLRSIVFLVALFRVKSEIGIRRPHFKKTREYLSFGLPTMANNILGFVVSLSDRYVITYFLGIVSVGIYSTSYAIANISTAFVGILGFIMPAALSQLYDTGRLDEVKTHLRYTLKYSLALSIPFVFGAALLAEPVLRIFSTSEIASQGYQVLPIVALGLLFMTISNAPAHILIIAKKTKIIALAWGLAAFVSLLLNILLVPHLGILGAAITSMTANLLALVIQSYYGFKELQFIIEWRFITKSLIASGIMALAIWLMHPQSNLDTIIAILVGVAIYGAVIFSLRGFAKGEIRFFRGLLQRTAPAENPNGNKAR